MFNKSTLSYILAGELGPPFLGSISNTPKQSVWQPVGARTRGRGMDDDRGEEAG